MKQSRIWLCLMLFLVGVVLQEHILEPLRYRLLPDGELVVDARIEEGGTFELYLNQVFERAYTQQIRQGEWHTYRFTGLPNAISYMRLDLTDTPDVNVEIRSIKFIGAEGQEEFIALADLKNWPKSGLVIADHGATEVLELKSSNNDPMILTGGLELGHVVTGSVTYLLANLDVVILLLLVCFALSRLPEFVFGLVMVCGVIYLCGVGWLTGWCMDTFDWPLDSVRQAIGYANYSGHSKFKERVFVLIVTVLVAVGGLLVGRIVFSFRRVSAEHDSTSSVSPSADFSPVFVIGALFIMAITLLPDAKSLSGFLDARHSVSNFDYNNIFTWQALRFFGFLPFKDYWFPYGGFSDQMGSLPVHFLKRYVHALCVYGVFMLSSYRLLGYDKGSTALLNLLVAIPVLQGWFLGTERYFLSIDVVLFYLALALVRGTSTLLYLAFGAFVGWVLTVETNQVAYSVPALLFIFVYLSREAWDKAEILAQLRKGTIAVGVAFLIAIIFVFNLSQNGQLDGYLSFYRNMSAMAISSAVVAPVEEWFGLPQTINQGVLVSLLLTVFSATFFWCKRERSRTDNLNILILACMGGTGLIVLLKMLIRPHMGNQVLVYGTLGFMFLLANRLVRCLPRQRHALSLALGIGLACLTGGNFLIKAWNSGLAKLNLVGFAKQAYSAFNSSYELQADYFSKERFTDWPEGAQAVVEFLGDRNLVPWESSFYMLGDQSMFYVALQQQPPRYLTFYDGANLDAQMDVLQWLTSKNPRYVIFDTKFHAFDLVPNIVRVPLLFKYVIQNYKPLKTFGRYEVLERSVDNQIAWEFWQERLPNFIELEFIPAVAQLPSATVVQCEINCSNYLVVDTKDVDAVENLQIAVSLGERVYRFSWKAEPGLRQYVIALDRLWFWPSESKLDKNIFKAESEDILNITLVAEAANALRLY